MAEWETSQLSGSSSDTENQEERDVHTPRTPIQNVNLSTVGQKGFVPENDKTNKIKVLL